MRIFLGLSFIGVMGLAFAQEATVPAHSLFVPQTIVESLLGTGTVYQLEMTPSATLSVDSLAVFWSSGCPDSAQNFNNGNRQASTFSSGVNYTTTNSSWYAFCQENSGACYPNNTTSIAFQWRDNFNYVYFKVCYLATLKSSTGRACTSNDCGLSVQPANPAIWDPATNQQP